MSKEIMDGEAAQKMIADFSRTMRLQNPRFRERYEIAAKNGYSQTFATIYAQQGDK